MADAATRAKLEHAQSLSVKLAKELAREPPPSPEHERALAEVTELTRETEELEGRLDAAGRAEDELLRRRAGGWNVVDLMLSAGMMTIAVLPAVPLAVALGSVLDLSTPVRIAAAVLMLPVPLLVNGLRYRRAQRRAAQSLQIRRSRHAR